METALKENRLGDVLAEAQSCRRAPPSPRRTGSRRSRRASAVDRASPRVEAAAQGLARRCARRRRKARKGRRNAAPGRLSRRRGAGRRRPRLACRPAWRSLINWQGYEIETSVFRAVVILAALLVAGASFCLVAAAPDVEQPGGRRPLPQQAPAAARPRCAVERHDRASAPATRARDALCASRRASRCRTSR